MKLNETFENILVSLSVMSLCICIVWGNIYAIGTWIAIHALGAIAIKSIKKL